MQMIDENKQENWGGGIVIALFLIFVAVNFSACASFEVYAGARRADTMTETRSAIDKPLKCFLTDCGGK